MADLIIPMNSKTVPPDKLNALLDDPLYIGEIKVDGYRCIYQNNHFHSRLGNDLTDKLKHLLEPLKSHNVTLDGELYIPGGNSSDITTALGKDGDKSKLKYCVFDILEISGVSLVNVDWKRRREILDEFMSQIKSPYIDSTGVHSDKRALLAHAEQNNLEGIMLKNTKAIYSPDKRPANVWYKVKKHDTADVVIMGYESGKGKYKGLVGSIIFGMYKGDSLVEFGKCSGITDAMRNELTQHGDRYIGKVIEIAYMERTKDGFFRHPVYKNLRQDKLAEQCIIE